VFIRIVIMVCVMVLLKCHLQWLSIEIYLPCVRCGWTARETAADSWTWRLYPVRCFRLVLWLSHHSHPLFFQSNPTHKSSPPLTAVFPLSSWTSSRTGCSLLSRNFWSHNKQWPTSDCTLVYALVCEILVLQKPASIWRLTFYCWKHCKNWGAPRSGP